MQQFLFGALLVIATCAAWYLTSAAQRPATMAATSAPEPALSPGSDVEKNHAAARKTLAEIENGRRDEQRADLDDAAANASRYETIVADAFIKIVLPLVLLLVVAANRGPIVKWLATHQWSFTLPGGTGFTAAGLVAVASNVAAAPNALEANIADGINAAQSSPGTANPMFNAILLRAAATNTTAFRTAYFERVAHRILTSQLDALEAIVGNPNYTVGDARKRFATAQQSGLAGIDFDDWLGFLTRFKLITAADQTLGPAQRIGLTKLGADFAAYARTGKLGQTLATTTRAL